MMRKAQVLNELDPNWLRHNWINEEQKKLKKTHITGEREKKNSCTLAHTGHVTGEA